MEKKTANKEHPSQQGLFGSLFSWLANVLMWMVGALIFSVFVEWTGMVFWWPEENTNHSRDMLVSEITYLNEDFTETVISSHPAIFVKSVAALAYEYMYVKTGIVRFIVWLNQPELENDSRSRLILKSVYEPASDFVLVGMTITQVFAVRFGVLILAIPLFILAAIVGLSDGLVERDLRRWGGGRESAFVYHWAKRPIIPTLGMSWIIYLGLPVSVHPNYIILPCAVLFGFLIAVTASRFKKYA